MTDPLTPPKTPAGRGLWRQHRKLTVTVAATVVSVMALGAALVGVMVSGRSATAERDRKLVELLHQVELADRALWTELNEWTNPVNPGQKPDESTLNEAAKALGEAAGAVGVGKFKLTDSEADEQIRLLLEDPVKRAADARRELQTGSAVGAFAPASFANLRIALADLTTKIASLMSDGGLRDRAEAYGHELGPEGSLPPRAGQDPPKDDPRTLALSALDDQLDTVFADASLGPVLVWAAFGLLTAAAVALWVIFAVKRKTWPSVRPPAPAAAQPPAAAGAAPSPAAKAPGTPKRFGFGAKKIDDAAAPAPAKASSPAAPAPAAAAAAAASPAAPAPAKAAGQAAPVPPGAAAAASPAAPSPAKAGGPAAPAPAASAAASTPP
ncbi:MAG: hypothetical protein LBO20_03325, partial [Bifidobacteriaceae bacterium]|nr:hypothetical protein [Bifidobacteriaceae bacterium]